LFKNGCIELTGGSLNESRFITLYTDCSTNGTYGWFLHTTPHSTDDQTSLEQGLQNGYHKTQGKYAEHSYHSQQHGRKREYPVRRPHNTGKDQYPEAEQQTGPADEIQEKLEKGNKVFCHRKKTAQQVHKKEK